MELLDILSNSNTMSMLDLLSGEARSFSELWHKIPVSKSAFASYVREMKNYRLIRKERNRYYLTDHGFDMLILREQVDYELTRIRREVV